MVLSRLTKITGPGVSTDTNWVGNNADFTGITTSGTSFNIGITTIHSNLIEAHNIKSTGILTATGGSFSGNVTAVDGTFSGNVSIAGTLTYEDVTNIDSVGIITAPALDVDDFLDVGSNIKLGNAGVVTATSFKGDGDFVELDVDGHTNVDNLSIAGVTTFSDNDIHFKNNGITSCRFDSNRGAFEFNHSGGLFWYKNGNLSNSSGATIFYSEHANQYKGLVIQAPWQGQTNAKNVTVMGSSNGRFYVQNNLNAQETFSAYFQAGVHLGYYQSGNKLSTTTTGVTLDQDLTVNRNALITGISTFTGNIDANGDIDVDGHTNLDNVSIAGVVTATTYYGDGSNLSNITSTTINNNADNRVITGSGTANTLEGEANLTFDGNTLQNLQSSAAANLTLKATSNSFNSLILDSNRSANTQFAILDGRWNGNPVARIQYVTGSDGTNKDDGYMAFHTRTSGASLAERLRITSDGKLGVGIDTPTEIFHIKKNDAGGPTITLENNANKAYINNWGSTGGGSGRTNRFEINATLQAQASYCAPYHTFMTGGVGDSYEKVRITSNGDLKLSGSTPLSSPNTGYKRIVIGNNLILNAGSSAGGYTGFQNNAYVNSSGNWVRVNNDYASSIGMDDGNIYFRNVGAGTGNISWSMPLQIYANGTSTFGSTVTVNGYVLSQGSSGRGGIFGQIQVGLENLYNTIQNAQANTPIHLQYNNTGDVKCNEGGGDLRTADIIPHTNNSSNLGSSTRRWANIHTNDLNLSNEGNSNEVDGTWGQYTIQEGQDDLFLINRRSGKRYKFLLQEID